MFVGQHHYITIFCISCFSLNKKKILLNTFIVFFFFFFFFFVCFFFLQILFIYSFCFNLITHHAACFLRTSKAPHQQNTQALVSPFQCPRHNESLGQSLPLEYYNGYKITEPGYRIAYTSCRLQYC